MPAAQNMRNAKSAEPKLSPWSIKGINPEARRLAKEAAKREGMTLGAWLTNKIIDEMESGAKPEAAQLKKPATAALRTKDAATAAINSLREQLETTQKRHQDSAAQSERALQDLNARVDQIGAGMGVLMEMVEKFEKVVEKLADAPAKQDDVSMEALMRKIDDVVEQQEKSASLANERMRQFEERAKRIEQSLQLLEEKRSSAEQTEAAKAPQPAPEPEMAKPADTPEPTEAQPADAAPRLSKDVASIFAARDLAAEASIIMDDVSDELIDDPETQELNPQNSMEALLQSDESSRRAIGSPPTISMLRDRLERNGLASAEETAQTLEARSFTDRPKPSTNGDAAFETSPSIQDEELLEDPSSQDMFFNAAPKAKNPQPPLLGEGIKEQDGSNAVEGVSAQPETANEYIEHWMQLNDDAAEDQELQEHESNRARVWLAVGVAAGVMAVSAAALAVMGVMAVA